MSSVVDAAKSTLAQNLGGAAHQMAPAHTQFALDDVPDQTGKVAVVTGGSEGSPTSLLTYGIGSGCWAID